MYPIFLRIQAGKLATLASDWQARRFQIQAAPRRRASGLRAALAGLAQLATMRATPGASIDTPLRHDPSDPRHW
jgi:hypothetical protein